jgi:sugar phosphate isomerase/epimerase
MRTGISSYTFPWAIGVAGFPAPATPLGAQDLLAKASALGVGVLQIADNLPLDRLTPSQLTELKDEAQKRGVVIEAGTRGVKPAHLRRYLEISRSIGAGFLRTLTHTHASQPGLNEIESWLREVLPEFASAGISIGLENYERHSSRDLAALIENVGSQYLGICLDTVNSFGAMETIGDVVQILAPYVINVHIKDFAIERIETMMGYSVTGRPAGEGQLDIDNLLKRIDSYGRRPNLILEQWPPFAGSLEDTIALEAEWATRGIDFLKNREACSAKTDPG